MQAGPPVLLRMVRARSCAFRYFIGCAGYPLCRACAFFPRSVTSVTVTKDVCTRVASCLAVVVVKFMDEMI